MKLWEHYHSPKTVSEADALLREYKGEARVLGGGTDLLLDMKQGNHPPVKALVDITKVEGLNTITIADGYAVIGAGVTHTQIAKSQTLAEQATCLVESCGVVGGPQVRNVGTIGGNGAHALPAGDGTTSLVTLDADVEILQAGEQKRVNILEMYKGPSKSLLDSTQDILLRFIVPLSRVGESSAFQRVMRPQGVALPILGCAGWLRLDSEQRIASARICIGPIAPTPMRVTKIEEMLKGKRIDGEALAKVVEFARSEMKPRTSKYRATAEYRLEMIDLLLRGTLEMAYHRARTGEIVPQGIGLQ